MSFWDKTVNNQQVMLPVEQQQAPIVLDEEAVLEMQGEEFDVFEDEEQDMHELMSDVDLRLEMGRVWKMLLKGNLFENTDADPKAIRNVERKIRNLGVEQMEIMVGIRREQVAPQQTIVSSPFNDMEVTVLKMLASKMSKGATESAPSSTPTSSAPQLPPKKDGITAISGNVRPNPGPSSAAAKPAPKAQAKAQTSKSNAKPVSEVESFLKKPIEQMNAEELAAHDKAALERRSKNYAALPTNLVPHPSAQELEMRYTIQAATMTNLVNKLK
jgi:predicted RNA-binding protein Jag